MTKKVVLLVEDNPDDEALIKRALQNSRDLFEVVTAPDGVKALDYLFGSDRGKTPSMILLDLKLPKLSGLEVLERIRADERTKFLPVIIFSSSDEERDMRESYRLGANSYVCKPVNFNEFADAVGQLGLYWLLINQRPPGKG